MWASQTPMTHLQWLQLCWCLSLDLLYTAKYKKEALIKHTFDLLFVSAADTAIELLQSSGKSIAFCLVITPHTTGTRQRNKNCSNVEANFSMQTLNTHQVFKQPHVASEDTFPVNCHQPPHNPQSNFSLSKLRWTSRQRRGGGKGRQENYCSSLRSKCPITVYTRQWCPLLTCPCSLSVVISCCWQVAHHSILTSIHLRNS